MLLHKFRVVPLALGLFAVAALAAAPSHGQPDIPRPVVAPFRVAAQPPAPPAKAAPAEIVVGRAGAYWRFDDAGKKLGEYAPPKGVQFTGGVAISPDGAWVAAAGIKDEPLQPIQPGVAPPPPFPLKLVLLPRAGGEPKVIDMPGFTLEPHWMPSGKELVVAQATGPGRTSTPTPA